MDENNTPKYTRIHRLLKVLTLIQSGQKCTPAELAKECGVAERTIFRDLNELDGAGFRIANTDGQYRIEKDRFLPPVQLTIQEALAMATLCEHLAQPEQIPFTRPAWDGLSKVLASVPQSILDELSETRKQMVIKTAASSPKDGYEDVYERMQLAIAERKTLVCQYESASSNGEPSEEFDFEPYTLFFSVRAWYVIGFHHGRGELRSLKLSRFSKASMTDRPYTIPADFSLDQHLGNAWRMMRGDDAEVELWFSPGFAETISDTVWHKTQEIEYNPDHSVTMRCTVSGFDEIVWWILSMGPNCKVIKPLALRDRVQQLAEQTAQQYTQAQVDAAREVSSKDS